MHILMLSDVYFPRINGVSTSIQTFREALQQLGHRVTLIAPDYPVLPPLEPADTLRVAAWQVPFDPEDRLMQPRALSALTDALTDHYDLLHIQTPFAAHYLGLRLARRLQIPVLESYHTFFEEYLHHYLPLLPARWSRYLARQLSYRQCQQVDGLVVPSPQMLATLREYGVTTSAEVIPTGIDPRRFDGADGARFRARYQIPATQPLLLYVGRVAHEKNIGLLLQVMARLRQQHPDALLVIAGEGPAASALQRQVVQLGIGDQVRFVGYLDRAGELQDCYAAADLFLFASLTETQGLVLLEAMMVGTPVVAIARMGTADVLREGCGARIAPDDSEGFAALVAALLADPQQRQALAASAREYATAWRADQLTARLVEHYGAVLAAAPHAPSGSP